jgi:hypothetical protein
MDLDHQIQKLIDEAPQDGATPQLVSAIAPVIKSFAQRLEHQQYYILQNLDNNWVLTTLQYQSEPAVEKTVIYAFSALKDVATGPTNPRLDPEMMALPIPVMEILFQLNAIDTIDSIVFFEMPGNLNQGTEIQRQELQEAIQLQIQQSFSPPNTLPPDIA